MYILQLTGQFKRDVKLCQKRGLPLADLWAVIRLLLDEGKLPSKYRPHKLSGKKYVDCWECHIQPNWLLVWKQLDDELIMIMTNTGSHSDLF